MKIKHRTDLETDPIFEVSGERGERGADGVDGRDGRDGVDGRDGAAGVGFEWAGIWTTKRTYKPMQTVYHKGSSWVCVEACKGREPSATSSRWDRMTKRGAKGAAGADGVSQRGPRGRDGSTVVVNGNSGEAIFDSATLKGQAVRVSGDGHVDLSIAHGSDALALVIGLAAADVASGATGRYVTSGPFTNSAWSLTPGAAYYLDPSVPGGITSTYPEAIGDYVCTMGIAQTEHTLNLNIDWELVIGV